MTAQDTQMDSSVRKWDEILTSPGERGRQDGTGSSSLAESDLQPRRGNLCPYCSKQIDTEVRLIGSRSQFSRLANEWEVSDGLRTRLSLIGRAVPLIARLTYLEITKRPPRTARGPPRRAWHRPPVSRRPFSGTPQR